VSRRPGASVSDEWIRVARKDWRRAERNLKDRDIVKLMFPGERFPVQRT